MKHACAAGSLEERQCDRFDPSARRIGAAAHATGRSRAYLCWECVARKHRRRGPDP